jgi:hypothetical protein
VSAEILTAEPTTNPAESHPSPKPASTNPSRAQVGRDFIQDYAECADVFEAPRESHEWNACQLIASVLNGKVFIPWGATTYPLDLWLLLLSESGQGRNTVTGVAIDVLQEAGIEGALRKSAWGSKQALYQQVAKSSSGLYDWPEFSEVMQKLNDPKFSGAKEWMTDRYDSLRIPAGIDYRETNKKSDTPPIVFEEPPRLNILATSSMEWFIANLQQPDTLGGFVPRWLLVRLGRSTRLLPKPLPLDREKIRALGKRLKAISELKGDADLSTVEEKYYRWYREAYARFQVQPNKGLGMIFSRLRGMVLKLAVIYEVSESCTLVVSDRAMQRAIEVARSVEKTIFDILPTGMTREGSEIEKMAELVRDAQVAGVSQSQVTLAFKHWKGLDRKQRWETLKEAGTIVAFLRATVGRPATIYVHADYADEHSRKFPGDKRQ